METLFSIRMRIEETEEILDSLSDIKMIFLVRDPRAVFHSRWSDRIASWCKNPHCAEPETSCQDTIQDIMATRRMIEKFPGKYNIERIYIRVTQFGIFQ